MLKEMQERTAHTMGFFVGHVTHAWVIKYFKNIEDGKMEENILFLCTGDADGCKKTHCYKNGGECMYTQEVKYAKNFEERFGGFVEKETRQEVEQLNSVLKQNVQILKKIKLSMRKR